MLDLTPIQILGLGVFLLVLVIIYFFREHLIDVGEILWSRKKFIAVCFVVFCVAYLVLTYKSPPPLPPEPVFSINITQIGYKWPG